MMSIGKNHFTKNEVEQIINSLKQGIFARFRQAENAAEYIAKKKPVADEVKMFIKAIRTAKKVVEIARPDGGHAFFNEELARLFAVVNNTEKYENR